MSKMTEADITALKSVVNFFMTELYPNRMHLNKPEKELYRAVFNLPETQARIQIFNKRRDDLMKS